MSTAEDSAHKIGLEQARRRAQWELGDSSWADVIVGAYLNPASDKAALDSEKSE